MSVYFEKGAADVYSQLGLVKEAISMAGIRTGLRSAGKAVKEFTVGKPTAFAKEVRSGKALAPGSMIRDSFKAPGLLNKSLFYGFPAIEAGSILTSSSENKGQELGGLIGGSVLGIGAFRPLGLVGSMAAGMAGDYIGRGVGGLGQKAVNAVKGKTPPVPAPQTRPLLARNPIGAAGHRQMQAMRPPGY